MPSVEFVDLAILFAAVEVVTGKAFDTFAEAARRTVADTSRFFKAVLRESDTTRCDDVTQLAASQPEIAVFLQGFLAEELPGTTGPSKLPRTTGQASSEPHPMSQREFSVLPQSPSPTTVLASLQPGGLKRLRLASPVDLTAAPVGGVTVA